MKVSGAIPAHGHAEQLLDLGRNAEGKDLRETQMILNHKAAIELLV